MVEERRWPPHGKPITLWICERGHVAESTVPEGSRSHAVCWACFPGGNGPATQEPVEVIPASKLKEQEERCERLEEALHWIADRPIPERNPDGEDQAAESMRLTARSALQDSVGDEG